MAAITGVLLGRSAVLQLSTDGGSTYTAVGSLTDVEFDRKADELEVTTFDDGADKAYKPNHREATLTGTLRYDESAANLENLEVSLDSQATYDWKVLPVSNTGNKGWSFQGFVSSLKTSAKIQDAVGFDFGLRITGAVTRITQ